MAKKLEIIWGILNKAEPFYYMLWKMMYAMPVWVRNGIEIAIILYVLHLSLSIVRQMVRFLCFGLEKLTGGIICGLQYLLILPFKWSGEKLKNNLAWMDENLNLAGAKLTEAMQKAQTFLKEKKFMKNKGRHLYVSAFIILFIAALIPRLAIIKSLNERYRTSFCIVQNQLDNFEQVLAPRINEYPEIFKEKSKDEEENTEEEVQEIYLELNQKGENGANIRKGPSLDDEIISVINSENKILYMNEKEDDGTRYWLKVQIDDKITGWLSGNLVQVK